MGLLASSRGIRILLGCLLFIVPLVFFTDLTRNPYYTQIALFNVLVSLLWIGWLLHGFRAGQWCWRTTAVDHPLAVLLLVALLSLGWSWGGHPAMRTPIANEGLRNTLFLWLNWALVFWFVVQGLPEGWLRWSWRLIEWVAVLAAGYGVLQSLGIEPIWPQGLNPYGTRPVSTFGNPTFLGSTLAMVLPWLCARWLLAVPGWRRWGLGLMMGGCFAGLLVTLTRSSWTGAAVGVGWVAWAWWRSVKPSLWWRRFLWLGGVALLLTWFWPRSAGQGYHPTVRERLQEVAQVAHGTYGAWHQRLLIWRCGWHMVQERPLLGKGWGCFELFYPFYQGQYLDNPLFQGFRTHANNAHNLILEWWAQTGTLGLGIWCWLMLTVLIAGRNTAQRLPGEASLLAHGWLGGMLAMLVDNLLNVSLFFSVPALVFWWTAGSLFVSARDRLKTRCWSRSAPLAASVAGVLIFFFIWQGARSVVHWVAEVQYFQGYKLARLGNVPAATSALELAHRLRRFEVNTNYELGNVYARQGRLDDAIWAYGEALAANAGYDEIYMNLGAALARQGRLVAARRCFQQTMLINPLSEGAKRALSSF